MKAIKVFLLLSFVFCIGFSQTATAAASQSSAALTTVVTKENQKLDAKNLTKTIKNQFKKVKKDAKKFLKDQKENVSNGKLLLLGLVGLALIGLGAIFGASYIAYIGSLLITIAIVWWILQLIGVV